MPQYDFDIVMETLTDNDKRRLIAMWCYEQPAKMNWDWVAKATGFAHGGSAGNSHSKLLKKLRDNGAVLDGSEQEYIIMPQFDFNVVWEILSDAEKKRIVAIWCYQMSEVQTDWAKVTEAAAGGQATVASVKTYHSRTLKKLKDAGAEIAEDGTTVGATSAKDKTPTPKSTPKKGAGRGRKRKATEDIPLESVEEEPVTKAAKVDAECGGVVKEEEVV